MFRKSILPLSILIILSLIIHFRWINIHGIITHGDWFPINVQSATSFIELPAAWSFQGLGSVSLSNSSYLLIVSLAWLTKIISYPAAEKLLILIPVTLFGILSTYMLFSYMFKSKLAIVTAVLIYNFNTYFLMLQTGHLTLALAFSFAPLVILLYQKTLDSQDKFWAIACGLSGFILGVFEFRALYLTLLICALYLIYFILLSTAKIMIRIRLTLLGLLPVVIILLLNLYWLVPSFSTGSISSNQFFSRDLFGQQFSQITYALNLYHPFWTNSKFETFHLQQIPIYAWIGPILFSASIFLLRKYKLSMFYALLAVIGIFLVKHLNPPFGGIYQWLYNYFPGFNAFRESSKFYFLIMLGYAGSIGTLIEYSHVGFHGRLKKYFTPILVLVTVIPFLFNSKPLINGEIGTLFIERSMPHDYQILNNYLESQPMFFRTIWVPTQSRWGAYSNDHPIISIVNLIYSYSEYLYSEPPKSVEIGDQIIALVKDDNFQTILDMARVKYVIVPIRDTENDDDFFINYGNDRASFVNSLTQVPFLKQIDLGLDQLLVFENTSIADAGIISVSGSNDSNVKTTNPTNYDVSFKSNEYPVDVNLYQSFNRGWIATTKHKDVTVDIPVETEFNQIFTNSFRVTKTGSEFDEKVSINISFQPQDAMEKYSMVSLLTLLICVLAVLTHLMKKCLKK